MYMLPCAQSAPQKYLGIAPPGHAIHKLVPITIEPLWYNEGDCEAESRCYEMSRPKYGGKLPVKICDPVMCFRMMPRGREVAVPYPTNFRARNGASLAAHLTWMQGSNRTALMSFVGGAHGIHAYFRMLLHHECASSLVCLHRQCISTKEMERCKLDHAAIAHMLHRSTFCLAPDGDTPTRQSWFDSILSGCIPVFFSTCLRDDLFYEHVYDPFLPAYTRTSFGAGDWAVLLNATAIYKGAKVETLLRDISDADVHRMQARLRVLAPRIQYSNGNTGTDDAKSILHGIIKDLSSGNTSP
jgi:hypothetical protein